MASQFWRVSRNILASCIQQLYTTSTNGTSGTYPWCFRPRFQVVDLSVADDSQLVIVGDTHGQLEDVLWIFFKYGWPSKQNRYLFNGDIVDRSAAAQESSTHVA